MPLDFKQRFCACCEVAPERYSRVVFAQALYPHARLLRPLIECLAPEFFAADREFVGDVGRLRRRRDFGGVADEFHKAGDNFRFLRRRLRLRASAARMKNLLVAVWCEEPPDATVAGAARCKGVS
jgi:hypothetical protein